MKPFSMHRRVAAVLAVAALAPALTAWSPAPRPAARVLACATVPVASELAARTGGQPEWDMPPVPGYLYAIAARSSTSAVAVGETLPAGAADVSGLVARWNGTAWKTLSSPALPPASRLFGVAVFRGGAWAVGGQDMSNDGDPRVGQPLLVRVTGTTVSQVPVPQAPQGTELTGVAASSATNAWAVGSIGGGAELIWHWNGTAWKNVQLPAAVARIILGVDSLAATSSTNLWLVSLGRIVHWNGRRWNVVSPRIGRPYGVLGVAATSARNVWAVGGTRYIKSRDVMLHWNGRRWTCVLGRRTPYTWLSAVSASSPDNAWAIGAAGGDQNLAVHWNGHTWKQVMIPQQGQSHCLAGITIIPRSDRAWVVGGCTRLPTGGDGTLMLHWNGTAWQ